MDLIAEITSSATSITVSLLVLVVTLYAIHIWRHFTLLRRYGIPGPTPWPFVGNAPDLFRKGTDVAENEWMEKYGKVFGFYTSSVPNVLITDPKVLKEVLIKDFPQFMNRQAFFPVPKLLKHALFFMKDRLWKQTRNVLTPAFSAGKLKQFVPILNKTAGTLVHHLSEHEGEDVDIKKFYGHFSMDSIAATAFGIDVDSQNQSNDPFVANVNPILISATSPKPLTLLAHTIPGLKRLLNLFGYESDLHKGITFYEETGQMLIDERRKHKTDRVDFIQILLEAQLDSSKSEYVKNGTSIAIGHNGKEQQSFKSTIYKMPDFDINAQAFLFFLAGYETTSSLLQFAAYVLATNPEFDRKLINEINRNIGSDVPTYETIGSLTYMDMFVDETLRFYPPAPRVHRLVERDTLLCGKVIPRGTTLHIPVYNIHHNPENYPDPEVFDPERFSAENRAADKKDGIIYLPFGAGPRHCIGMRLALVEAKLALVHVLRKVKFVKCEKTPKKLELTHFGILRPKEPIFVRAERR